MYFYFLAGLEYDYIRFNQNSAYYDTSGDSEQIYETSKIWGIGPELGITYDYRFCQFTSWCYPSNLSLVLAAAATLLASRDTYNLSSPYVYTGIGLNTVTIVISDDATWRVIPVAHLRLGCTYEMAFKEHTRGVIEIGYEFNSYFRALKNSDNQVYESGFIYNRIQTENYLNFDLQGLYVTFAFMF